MARITVTSDDGRMTHSERVIPDDLNARHFRECLLERLEWAITDADLPSAGVAPTRVCRHAPNGPPSPRRGAAGRRGWEAPEGARVFAS